MALLALMTTVCINTVHPGCTENGLFFMTNVLVILEKADCTITMGDDDLLGLMTGTLNAQKVTILLMRCCTAGTCCRSILTIGLMACYSYLCWSKPGFLVVLSYRHLCKVN